VKGRSRKIAGRHYQKLADAEVARIRASVPEAPPVPIIAGQCKTCGGDYIRFGKDYSHLDYTAAHVVAR